MKEFGKLVKVVDKLRSPQGCPWDRAQTIKNMKGYLLEETYELIDGIDKGDPNIVKEELGDVFLILVVIAKMFQEKKKFSLADVLDAISLKLILRHPHVFSSKRLKNKEEVLNHWIKNKAKSKKRKSIQQRLPLGAPSLLLLNIFLKEDFHLKKNQLKNKKSKASNSEIICDINNKLNRLKNIKKKENLFSEIIFDIAKLAFIYGVDLESGVRKKTLKEAQKITY